MKALSIVLLVSLVLAACGTGTSTPVPVFAPLPTFTPEVAPTETAVLPTICDNGSVFSFGQVVELGKTEDYTAYLEVNKSVRSGYRLNLLLGNGEVFNVAGGELPKRGETRHLTWEPYVDLTIANCGRVFHYQVDKLLGAEEARPVEDPGCTVGYNRQGLKPYPFVSSQSVYASGTEEVFLISATDSEIYLARVQEEKIEEAVAVKRPREGEIVSASIPIAGGMLTVEVKSCSGNYFFKSNF